MLTKNQIESLNFTFLRRIEGPDNYTGSFNSKEDRDEYIACTIYNNYQNVILLQNFDDGKIAIIVLFSFINQHWSNEYLFTSDKSLSLEELKDIIDNKLKITINKVNVV